MLIWGTDREGAFWPLEARAAFDRRSLDTALRDALIEESLALCGPAPEPVGADRPSS